jgi:hypothetical protein
MTDPSAPRVQRPVPEREKPQRNGTAANFPGGEMARRVEHLVQEGFRTAQHAFEAATDPVLGVAERGVHTAYAVIDDYLARGRAAAERQKPHMNGRNSMNGNGYDGNGTQGWGPWGPMNNPFTAPFTSQMTPPFMTPLMAPWVQMMRMWGEAMSAFVPGGAQAMNQMMGAWGGVMGVGGTHCAVSVASRMPTRVIVHVEPGTRLETLRAEELRPGAGTAGLAFAGASLSTQDGRLTADIRVPADQPPGTYVAQIVDEGRYGRGTITVELHATAEPPPSA